MQVVQLIILNPNKLHQVIFYCFKAEKGQFNSYPQKLNSLYALHSTYNNIT
jgi:hypothetical protein